MKWKELKGLAVEDLPVKMAELKLQLMKDNAQVAIGTVPKSPGRIRAFKRTIARIHTLMTQKLMVVNSAASGKLPAIKSAAAKTASAKSTSSVQVKQ